MRRRVLHILALTAEVFLGLVATLAIGVGLVWWRLSSGPIDVPFVARHVAAELTAARDGRPVTIERASLVWNEAARAVELKVFEVQARDAYGRVLSVSREVAVGLAPQRLLVGQVSLARAEFRGGQASIVLARDGSSRLAFGPPGSEADLIVPPPAPNETLTQRANRILDALEAMLAPRGAGAHLRYASVSDLAVTVLHEASGATWTAERAEIAFERDRQTYRVSAEGVLRSDRGAAPAALSITSDRTFQEALVELRVDRARLDALAPGLLGVFKTLEAPLTAQVSAALDRKQGVRGLEFDARLGRGALRFAAGPAPLNGGRVRARYELDDDTLFIEEIEFGGLKTRISGGGRLTNASDLLRAEAAAPAAFDLDFKRLDIDAPGVFEAPLALSDLTASGVIDLRAPAIDLSGAAFSLAGARARASGRLWWARGEDGALRPGLKIDAALAGSLTPQAVLAGWPIKAGESARNWTKTNVRGGRIEDVRFAMNAAPGALGRFPLPDEALDLTFRFADAEATYLSGSPLITNGVGRGRLRGNSFEVDLETGALNGLALSQGQVRIPRLHPAGAVASYGAKAQGEARAMLAALLAAPLGLEDKLPFDVASLEGRGAVDFKITRPTGRNIPAEAIGFTVAAQLDQVAAREKGGGRAISDWRLSLTGDQRALTFAGPLQVDGSKLDVVWTQTLRGAGPPSRYRIAGVLGVAQIEAYGVPVSPYARGSIGVSIEGEGEGFDPERARISLDLAAAEVQIVEGFWRKPVGRAATASFALSQNKEGGRVLSDIDARGPGLRVLGSARFLPDGRLAEANLARLSLGDSIDGRLQAQRRADGVLAIDVRGASVNLGAWLDRRANAGPGPEFPASKGPPESLLVSIAADRLAFKGDAALPQGSVRFATRGEQLTQFDLASADTRRGFTLSIAPQPRGPAKIRFLAPDAGLAWEALTGQDNLRGGRAEANGTWTPNEPTQARLTLTMRDFELVQAPVMAQLLSSVGSLRGALDMLNGEGIAFAALEAPISIAGDRLHLGESRMSGPSVGLTANGAVNLADGRLALDGVLVPSYGLNSFLGGVPILGGLLTSRRGEGVVGITFSMRGPAEDARVFVNPLSALAPGIFRRIFQPFAVAPNPPPAPERGG